ncbi:MAG TPA: metalloregulator ArsR/SmtB family transcription factor, partial [Nitrospirae bacterium]|nr:metalloregulator ArsR/SmtB family transcription factor [Nitrospirota bacterium]
GKALSNGNRLEMLEYLAQGERSVDSLATIAKLSVANTSQHLQLLRQSGLVNARKEGQRVLYSIADDSVLELLESLRKTAGKSLAEVELLLNSYWKVKDSLEPVPADELMKRSEQGLVTIYDVRPPEEFNAGHIPGSINVPLKELEKQLKDAPKDKEIVAYCRGPHCVLAFDAVASMRVKGFNARRLEDGFPEWKRAGRPVETGSQKD